MMIQAKNVTGTVVATKRVGTSTMGNPQFDVTLLATHIEGTPVEPAQTVVVRTSANISLAYAIENPEYRETAHTFDLTPAGRLSGRAVAVNA